MENQARTDVKKGGMTDTSIASRIIQRRTQMFIHSYLYYVLDRPIVDDQTWQRWADELTLLQRNHPKPVGFYDVDFSDWDGSTGYHLPQYLWVVDRGHHLLRLHDQPALRVGSQSALAAPMRAQASLQASLF